MKIGAETPAIVTGGASGLGEAAARALAARGAKVAILDLSKRGEEVAREIGGLFVETDVTSTDSVEASIRRASEAHGVGRIVVNCAGVATPQRTLGREGPIDMGHYEQVVQIMIDNLQQVGIQAVAQPMPTET